MTCENDLKVAGTIATIAAGQVPQRGFKEALAEVRKQGRPFTLDVAEAAAEALGGVAELGRMMVNDLKMLRGDDLTEESRAFHDPDWKVVNSLYGTLTKLMAERDSLVGESGNPLDDVSEEDLLMIASQGALLRIEADGDFRRQLLEQILDLDAELILEFAGKALDKIEAGPKVEVIDAT